MVKAKAVIILNRGDFYILKFQESLEIDDTTAHPNTTALKHLIFLLVVFLHQIWWGDSVGYPRVWRQEN